MNKLIVAFFILITISGILFLKGNLKPEIKSASANLPSYTAEQLKNFDGSDPKKPILLAMDGLVYDVTPGKEFYQTGAVYHYLAGKDSSNDLHIAGGAIIKRKYKVVGTFQP